MSGLTKFQKLKALHHILISISSAILSLYLAKFLHLDLLGRLMLSWVVFCLVQVGISWYIFAKTTASQVKSQATLEDESRAGIFLLVVFATFAGLLAVFLVLVKDNQGTNSWLQITLAILGMFLSWFLVHTVFAVRYAHIYYNAKRKTASGGLKFPDDTDPDFIDFAYYSLVIGMTFQVSDVDITSRQMRRFTLLHSLIAFIFNTCIVALTISAIAGLAN